ncbi:MAG: protein translocase subunit SecD [Anaerolineales bacterium]|nr:protein translocase subunit SecD [Anaerolineales bacterium]
MRSNQQRIIPILIVIALAIFIDLPNHPGIHIGGIDREIKTHLGLDLVGGVQALLEADLPEDTAVDPESMRTARRIIESRVNALGVSEAVVQIAGDRRILIELPGESDPEKAFSTVRETALLEFVHLGDIPTQEIFQLAGQTIQTDFGQQEDPVSDQKTYHTVMTGAAIKQVGVQRNQTTGDYLVGFELTAEGAQTFAEYTTQNVGNALAIVLDKKVLTAPQINEPITGGVGSISGNFTAESANELAIQLRYGSLPIPLKIVQTETIGPTLGDESLDKSLVAGVIGLAVVMIFMALYYRLPGVIADLALIVYALITFAFYRLIPVTLTLPGIAGFVLSIGVAVDANVLIFERLKEELRNGRTIRQAINLGWDRAWPSIRDSNLSTLITSAILYWFGNAFGASIVKGFSLTLAVGVLVSLFTAVTVTRTFLHIALDNIKAAERPGLFGV